MLFFQPKTVPGQSTSGIIDGFNRNPTADGTLGKPDYSPLPYAYAAMLSPSPGQPQWALGSVSTASGGAWGGFKGNSDGNGVLRDTGSTDSSVLFRVVLDTTGGTLIVPQWGKGLPASAVWNRQDLVIALRSQGTGADCYLAFLKGTQNARFFSKTSASVGNWDVEPCDQPGYPLSGKVNLWDGYPHDIIVTQVGNSVFALIDYKIPVTFPTPGVYHYSNGSPVDPTFTGRNGLPVLTTETFMGIDTRSNRSALLSWTALLPSSADGFLWQPAYGPIEPATSSTITPTSMDSNQSWTISGTATASKDGVLLAGASSIWFTPFRTSGWLSTRFGSVASQGGVVFRRQDASNYLVLTQAGTLQAVVAGVATTLYTLPSAIASDTDVVIRYNATTAALAVNNGATVYGDMAGLTTGVNISGQVSGGTGVGFVTPTGASSQFRYVYFQPDFTVPVVPTS